MAISLSGTNQYYLTTTTPVTGAPLTLSIRARPAVDQIVFAFAIGDSGATTDYISLLHQVTTRTCTARSFDSPTTGQAISSSGMSTGVWSHLCGVTASNSSRTSYLDGGNSGTNSTDVSPDSLDRIGIGSVAYGNPATVEWNGDLYQAAIWDVALTAAQVTNLADGFSPLTVQRQNLVFFARCEYPGPIDMIGYRTLTATGTPTVSANPNGVMRVLPRGRGRSRLRLSA